MKNENAYGTMEEIINIADKGKSTLCSMGSQKKLPFSFNDLHFVPAQISKIPRDTNELVNTQVVIGPEAKKPLHSFFPNNVQ